MTEIATTDPLAGVLAELAPRQVANDKIDRDAWLRARLYGVTATVAKVCLVGSASEKAAELKKKLEGDKFTGTKNTDFGSAREAYLLEQAGAVPYGWLVHAVGNERHLATPDGLRKTWGGFAVVEAKTSKYPIGLGTERFDAYGYLWQILWQMYVTGTDEAYYVWEQHDDDWSRWNSRPRDREDQWHLYGPKRVDGAVEHITLAGLEEQLKKQIRLSDAFLKRLDKAVDELRAERAAAAAEEAPAAELSPEDAAAAEEAAHADALQLASMDTQARLYRNGLDAEKIAKESAADARGQLLKLAQARYGDEAGERFLSATGGDDDGDQLRMGYSPASKKFVSVADVEAAKKADPDLWAEVEASRTAATAVEDRWKAHQAQFSDMQEKVTPASVRVTPQKGSK